MATSVQTYIDSVSQFVSSQPETHGNVINVSFHRPHVTPLGLSVRRGESSDRLVISAIQPLGCVDSALKQQVDKTLILPGDSILSVNGHSECQQKMLAELSTAHDLHVAVIQCSSSRGLLTTLKENDGFDKMAEGKQPDQFSSLTSTCVGSQSLDALGDVSSDDAWSSDYDSDFDPEDKRMPQRSKCMHELPSLSEIFDDCPPGDAHAYVPVLFNTVSSACAGANVRIPSQQAAWDSDDDSDSEDDDHLPQRSNCMEEFPSLAEIFDNCSSEHIHACMPELHDKSVIVVSSEISRLLSA